MAVKGDSVRAVQGTHQQPVDARESGARSTPSGLSGKPLDASTLLASARRQHELYDHAVEALFSTTLDGLLLEVNAAAAVALAIEGGSRPEALALCVIEEDRPAIRDVLDVIPDVADVVDLELHLSTPSSGRVLWAVRAKLSGDARSVLWSASPIIDRDATRLRRLVLDKAELLERERRRFAIGQAASAAKDRLIAILGEDSRSTLNSVLGWTHLLRTEVLDRLARDQGLSVIQANVERHLSLIAELTELTRDLDGEVQLDLELFHLLPLVDHAVAACAALAAARGVVVQFTPAAKVDVEDRLLGDRRKLKRLVQAAIECTLERASRGDRMVVETPWEDRSIVLRIAWGPTSAPKDHQIAATRPSALVLAPRSRLLDPDRGFVLVDRVARIHRGTARVTTDADGRSVLEVRLPRFPDATGDGSVVGPEHAMRLAGVRVLVLEADPDMRELASLQLRRHGASVVGAPDAPTAVAAVAAFEPRVVVADVRTVDEHRDWLLPPPHAAAPVGHGPPAIVGLTSVETDRGHAGVLRLLGPDAIVAKPLEGDALYLAVCRRLRIPARAWE
jgi:signal transduction histidine kinase